MDTLEYVRQKFGIDLSSPAPITFRLSRHSGLTSLWRELGYKKGAEIGVEQGMYSQEICKNNPGVELYCIDPWEAYSRYLDRVLQPKLDRYYTETLDRLAPYGCKTVRKPSMEAVKDFAPDSLDFVFIDGNHEFEYVVNDIISWAKIVRPGGILAGHDYKPEGQEKRTPLPFHVIQAVNAYTDAYKIKPWFIIRGDRCPSWFWVKA